MRRGDTSLDATLLVNYECPAPAGSDINPNPKHMSPSEVEKTIISRR
jgi:hypothetical protein